LNLRLTRLADAVRAAIEGVQPSADVRKVRINSMLSEDIGVVRADPERIQQVIWNLVSNAVKFTPTGGRIDVKMTRLGNDVCIVIQDTGIGINPEFLPHVFERFRQAEVITTRQHSGLGLGLAIAKQLVELHGGTITASSEGEGLGSTFTVQLPLAPTVDDPPEPPETFAALPQGVDNLRILLVEDDAGSRMATARALELRGAVIDAVANPASALAAYTQMRPDAMILDIGLPGEDGYSLMKRFRNLETAQQLTPVPAIALTAFARNNDRERAFAAGFDEHLAKPVDIEAVVAVLLRLTRATRS
jgi:CheY-like chemotaxis protein